jgi:hypothetical protein
MTGEMTWHSLRYLPFTLAGFLAMVCIVLWLYPPQVRFISRPWRWVLPALRIAALSALALSVLKPVVTRARESDRRDALVVLIDRSRSMSVVDTSRSPADYVALADGLGLLPGNVRNDPVAGMEAAIASLRLDAEKLLAAQNDAKLAALDDNRQNETRIKLDQTNLQYKSSLSSLQLRSEMFPRESLIFTAIAGLDETGGELSDESWNRTMRSRFDQVEHALAEMRAAADAELYQSNEQVKAACDQIASASRLDIARLALSGNSSGIANELENSLAVHYVSFSDDILPLSGNGSSLEELEANGFATDVAGAIQSSATQLSGREIAGFVVLSDGRVTKSRTSPEPPGAPVYAVNVSARQPGRDLSINRVHIPSRLHAGDSMPLRIDLLCRGVAGAVVDVSVSGEGIDQSQRLTLTEETLIPVEFTIKLDHVPVQDLTIAASVVPGEITQENNQVSRRIKVISEKLNVATYSGSPSWDFQYLRNALSRIPWVNLEEAILPSEAVKPALTSAQILNQDVIVLHDLAAASLSGEQWSAVHRLVTERGGSLILVAGDGHLPAEYGQNEILASFLPYRGGLKPVWRVWPGQAPAFQIVPAPGTEAIDALRLSDDPVEGRQRWHVLPPWFRYLAIAELKPNTTPLLIERDSGAPVLTEARLGLGHVYFFGGNETWRWRYKVGETLQDRFWLQLLRYAAGEPYAVTSGGLSLDMNPVSIEPGANVRVRARVRDATGKPSVLPEASVQVARGNDTVLRPSMVRLGDEGSGQYETVISNLAAGDYQIMLTSPEHSESSVAMPLRVAASDELEMSDVAGDESYLQRLAQSTNGEYLSVERIGELPELISSRKTHKTIVAEYPLWDSPYLFVFFVACVGAEWALRKSLGLA